MPGRAVQVQAARALGPPLFSESLPTDSASVTRAPLLSHFYLIYSAVMFLPKPLFRDFRAGLKGTQEREEKQLPRPSNEVLL